jgi:DivIVA domain-containing protein
MELTPLDIRNQTFRSKRFGGVDPAEVKAFLETAAQAFEQQGRLRTDLTERLKLRKNESTITSRLRRHSGCCGDDAENGLRK